MARYASALAATGLAGILAGCVYDPVSHAYEPCCAPAYAAPAYAPPPPAYAPPPQQYAQSTPQPPGAVPPPREPFIERFQRANVTHDGKLTLDQARAAGMHMIVAHFGQIDVGHKGYVTIDDIRAARAERQQMKQGAPPPPQPAPPQPPPQ